MKAIKEVSFPKSGTTNKTIIEGNQLIAEYMGFRIWFRDGQIPQAEMCDVHHDIETWAQYHYSWDWLMPCLQSAKDKIKSSGWGVLKQTEATKRLEAALNEVFNLNIENAHYCFVQFIKWYNQQK